MIKNEISSVSLDKIVGGGQTLGTMPDGRKVFCWGGLPGEIVDIKITKKKSNYLEAIATNIIKASPERVQPADPSSYLSTSPWQIMSFEDEQGHKSELIQDAFRLQNIALPNNIDIYSDQKIYGYRNKVEFSWYWDNDKDRLELSFYRRGSHHKIPVEGTSLARSEINQAALGIRDMLRRHAVQARHLKTLMIRCNQSGDVSAQLYVQETDFANITDQDFENLDIQGLEIILSDKRSPASVITKRLKSWGQSYLSDQILGIPFHYTVDSFFQINIPVYERALDDMKAWIDPDQPTIDFYSGVGSIGLTIGGSDLTLIEINQSAIAEMKRNIKAQKRQHNTKVISAASESATGYITPDATIVVDPPRAGLHSKVIDQFLDKKPKRILYLSCNPVTQGRDIAMLSSVYEIRHHRGYNFFPRTPHIEHLVVLDKKDNNL